MKSICIPLLLFFTCISLQGQNTFYKSIPGMSAYGKMIEAHDGSLVWVNDSRLFTTNHNFSAVDDVILDLPEEFLPKEIIQLQDKSFVILLEERTSTISSILIRLDHQKNLMWVKKLGMCQIIQDITPGIDRGFVCTGDANVVVKINDDGTIAWQTRIIPDSYTEGCGIGGGCGISVTSVKSSYVIAGFWGLASDGSSFPVLYSVDLNGNPNWFKAYQDNYHYYNCSVTAIPDKGFTITGTRHEPSDDFDTQSVYIIQTNTSGDLVWQKDYRFNVQTGQAFSAVAAPDGGLAVTGTVHHTGNPHNQILFFSTDFYGNVLTAIEAGNVSLNGEGEDNGYGLVNSGDSIYYLLCGTGDGMSLASLTLTGDGFCNAGPLENYVTDATPVQVNAGISTINPNWNLTDYSVSLFQNSRLMNSYCTQYFSNNEISFESEHYGIFPNPVSGEFTIITSFKKSEIEKAELFSVEGIKKPLIITEISDYMVKADISAIAPGTYLVMLCTNTKAENLKLLIVR